MTAEVAEARVDLEHRYNLKLKLLEAKAKGRTTTLRSRLDEAKQSEKAAAAALTSVQDDLASAHAELL